MVRTAVLMALLVVLQTVTKAAGQLVTGSCVNTVLAVAALLLPLGNSLFLAILSPWLAFLLGIGPQLLPVVPCISLGNAVYTFLLWLPVKKKEKMPGKVIGTSVAAAAKFAVLFLLIPGTLCRVLELPPKQTTMFQTMFSWPQLVTALIGGALALPLISVLKRADR